MSDNIIGKRIKEAMKKQNLKQSDIVKKTGINKGALSSYISGKYEPKHTTIYKLASVLNVTPAWIMGYNPTENTPTQNIILFTTTFYELLRYYNIAKEEFSRKSNIAIEEIDAWLTYKKMPDKKDLEKICTFFNIGNGEDFFNGMAYFNLIDKYTKVYDNPQTFDRYKFSFVLEDILNDISKELSISVQEIKSILFDRFKKDNSIRQLCNYEDLYLFLLNYIKKNKND